MTNILPTGGILAMTYTVNVMVKLNVETGDYNCKYRDLESCSQQRET